MKIKEYLFNAMAGWVQKARIYAVSLKNYLNTARMDNPLVLKIYQANPCLDFFEAAVVS